MNPSLYLGPVKTTPICSRFMLRNKRKPYFYLSPPPPPPWIPRFCGLQNFRRIYGVRRIQKIPRNIAEKREKLLCISQPNQPACDFQNTLARYILELSIFWPGFRIILVQNLEGQQNFGGVAEIQSVSTLISLAELAQNLLFSALGSFCSGILPRNSRETVLQTGGHFSLVSMRQACTMVSAFQFFLWNSGPL